MTRTLIHIKDAAAMLGIGPEQFRRNRNLGCYTDIEFYKPPKSGANATRVVRETVEEHKRRNIMRGGK